MESVVTNGSKVGEFGKVSKEQNVKNVVMNAVKSGEVRAIGKLSEIRLERNAWLP